MNFFASQDQARRYSARLIWLFIATLIALTLGVNVTCAALYVLTSSLTWEQLAQQPHWWSSVPRWVFFAATCFTVVVMVGGAWHRGRELAQGGRAVARLVGGQRLKLETDDINEQRLLNVVAEMSIASGIVQPAVYVLPNESGINAFAAGWAPHDAAIVVTRGLLDTLNRDQLQGVVAHEFSHIFNGDMRINIRLLGLLNGVSMIGSLGRFLLREGHGTSFWTVLVGLVLTVLGYVGVLSARVIKSAVSRQREFLADASAVQYTRNPSGIASALTAILQHAQGGTVHNRYAEELSHFFFVGSLPQWFNGWFATHPPLLERIRRIAPHVIAVQPRGKLRLRSGVMEATAGFVGEAVDTSNPSAAATARTAPQRGRRKTPAEDVGALSQSHLRYAADFFLRLPAEFKRALRSPSGSAAIVVVLLLESNGADEQSTFPAPPDSDVAAWLPALRAMAVQLSIDSRLPLLELAVPALRQFEFEKQKLIQGYFADLIAADNEVSPWEFVIATLVDSVLEPRHFTEQYARIEALAQETYLVLKMLSVTDARNPSQVANGVDAGCQLLGLPLPTHVELERPVDIAAFSAALRRLARAHHPLRRRILEACTATVSADSSVTDAEFELLRAVAVVLDCPIPPSVYTLRLPTVSPQLELEIVEKC